MNQRLNSRIGLAIASTALSLSMALSAVSIAKCVAEPVTTIEMRECASKELKSAEHHLEASYQALLTAQSSLAQQKLKASQQAWQDYRDAQCEFEANQYEGGTISPLIHVNCLVRETNGRTQLLNRLHKEH